MEDYKKKYEKALEGIKELYENRSEDPGLTMSLREIFPELKESNEEKIRKAIIRFVNDKESDELYGEYGIEKCKALKWLEDQKSIDVLDKDERRIEECAREAEDCNCIILAKHIRRLKSLTPQSRWKPSDAQMASITCAVRKMKESACYDSELVSLLNDLKKLKG